jgi:uncharacterized protein (DUF2336 family)
LASTQHHEESPPTGAMNGQSTLIHELEGVLRDGAAARGATMLRQVTSLLVDGGFCYSAEQIELFDQVLGRLADGIEATVRAELSLRLCDANVAPPRLLRRLALDEIIDVAAPVLCRSDQLDDSILIECVNTRSQGHLLAISRRRQVSQAVTDRLVVRGELPVLQSVVDNPGSRFSDSGFATLVLRAEGNDALATGVGFRVDLPRHQFLRLLSMASQAVRERLEAANPQNARDIQRAVARVTETITTRVTKGGRDFSEATKRAHALKAAGSLGDREILQFLKDRKLDDAIAAVAVLAELDAEAVEQATLQTRAEPLLTVLKAVGLGWPTAKAFLHLRTGERELPANDVERSLASFARLSAETARQTLLLKARHTPHATSPKRSIQ